VVAARRPGDRGVAVVVGVMIGPAGPTWWRVPLALLDRLPLISVDSGITDTQWQIIWQIRMPRVVSGRPGGCHLSAAGASYQGVFRNPLVDPYLLGVAAGAGLGATLVFTVGRTATAGWPIDPLARGGVPRRARGRDPHVPDGCHVRRFPGHDDPRARRGGCHVAGHGHADLRPAAQQRRDPTGVQLDPGSSQHLHLVRRAAGAALRDRVACPCCSPTGVSWT
jgi:hypothetical protein